jgi:hypothetical protein
MSTIQAAAAGPATPSKPQPKKKSKQRLTHSAFAALRGVSGRTIDRWVAAKILPPPEYVNGRKYWDPDVEPRQDAAAAAAE